MEGIVLSPLVSSKVFQAAAGFPIDFVHAHINTKKTFTFQAVWRLSVDDQTGYRRGGKDNIDVDNITCLILSRKVAPRMRAYT